jgi:nitrogen fixation negative regulator NifL
MNEDNKAVNDLLEALTSATHHEDSRLPPWLFAETVEKSPVAVCISDQDANILYVNSTFTAVTGYGLSEILGKNASILSHRSTPSRIYEQMWSRLKQGESWTGLLVNRHKQGTVYLAELTVIPLLRDDGNTSSSYYLGMHRDVTAVHRLEQQALNQKRLIESMVDAAPAIIALLDEHGRVILDNHEYKKLVGDLGGRRPATELLQALTESRQDAARRGDPVREGFQHKEISFGPTGRGEIRWFSCSGTWFEEQDDGADAFFEPTRKSYLLLMANEITHLKRQQEALGTNTMRALLAEQERVRATRETLEAVIFQMQGPINLITAANAMLERRSQADDLTALRSVLTQALMAGREVLLKLQNSIPAVPPEAIAPVNINHLLREVLTLLTQRMLAGGMVVEWTPASSLPAVAGRESRLRGMFKQLVDNALDAMESQRSAPRELRITTRAQQDGVLVTIDDTGPGVPADLRLKIFEPFVTSKGSADRTGLGLAMVQEVVNEHRGMIDIDPEYTQGCRFRVLLPIDRDERYSD